MASLLPSIFTSKLHPSVSGLHPGYIQLHLELRPVGKHLRNHPHSEFAMLIPVLLVSLGQGPSDLQLLKFTVHKTRMSSRTSLQLFRPAYIIASWLTIARR